jgi:hypothetical protein
VKVRRVLPVIVPTTVLTVLAGTVVLSASRFTMSRSNATNAVQAGSMGLSENGACPTPGDGQWRDCAGVNVFGGGTLASGGSRTTSVTMTNTGTTTAQLFLLPSQCSDSDTGARGARCDGLTIQVVCAGTTVVATRTLNAFYDGRNLPTGYPAGTLAAGASMTCGFTLTAGSIPGAATVSQPISWKSTTN